MKNSVKLLALILTVSLPVSVQAHDKSPQEIIQDAGGMVYDVITVPEQQLLTMVTDSVLNQQTSILNIEQGMSPGATGLAGGKQGIDLQNMQQLIGIYNTYGTAQGTSNNGATNPAFTALSQFQPLTQKMATAAQSQAQELNYDPNTVNALMQLNNQLTRVAAFDSQVRAIGATSAQAQTLTGRYGIMLELKKLHNDELNQLALNKSIKAQGDAQYNSLKLQDTQREIAKKRGESLLHDLDY